MQKESKSREGYCKLSIPRGGAPLVVYRNDKTGEPILDEREILLIKAPGNPVGGVNFLLNGESYQWVRGELFDRPYDPNNNKLSRENWEKLKEIVTKKVQRLEGRI